MNAASIGLWSEAVHFKVSIFDADDIRIFAKFPQFFLWILVLTQPNCSLSKISDISK